MGNFFLKKIKEDSMRSMLKCRSRYVTTGNRLYLDSKLTVYWFWVWDLNLLSFTLRWRTRLDWKFMQDTGINKTKHFRISRRFIENTNTRFNKTNLILMWKKRRRSPVTSLEFLTTSWIDRRLQTLLWYFFVVKFPSKLFAL